MQTPTKPTAKPAPKPYATTTVIPAERTIVDVYNLFTKRGATRSATYDDHQTGRASVFFEVPTDLGTVSIALHLPLPDPEVYRRDEPPIGKAEQKRVFPSRYEQERARMWRVIYTLLEAKIRAIEEGATVFEREFLADQVIYDDKGQKTTVYEWVAPQLQQARQTGLQPALLPAVAAPAMIRAVKD